MKKFIIEQDSDTKNTFNIEETSHIEAFRADYEDGYSGIDINPLMSDIEAQCVNYQERLKIFNERIPDDIDKMYALMGLDRTKYVINKQLYDNMLIDVVTNPLLSEADMFENVAILNIAKRFLSPEEEADLQAYKAVYKREYMIYMSEYIKEKDKELYMKYFDKPGFYDGGRRDKGRSLEEMAVNSIRQSFLQAKKHYDSKEEIIIDGSTNLINIKHLNKRIKARSEVGDVIVHDRSNMIQKNTESTQVETSQSEQHNGGSFTSNDEIILDYT